MGKNKQAVELKPRAEKVSEQHLKEMLDVVNKINSLQFNIGRLESQKHKLLHELALGNDSVGILQDKMLKEYGSYDINLTVGNINWPKEPSDNGVEKPKEDEK